MPAGRPGDLFQDEWFFFFFLFFFCIEMYRFYEIQDWGERIHRYLGRGGTHFIVEVENWHLVGQM